METTTPCEGCATRRPLAKPQEIADYCGIPVHNIYRWSSRGGAGADLPLIKVGRHLRARWSDLDAWLDSHRVQPRDGQRGL